MSSGAARCGRRWPRRWSGSAGKARARCSTRVAGRARSSARHPAPAGNACGSDIDPAAVRTTLRNAQVPVVARRRPRSPGLRRRGRSVRGESPVRPAVPGRGRPDRLAGHTVLAEMTRVTQPSGRVVVLVPDCSQSVRFRRRSARSGARRSCCSGRRRRSGATSARERSRRSSARRRRARPACRSTLAARLRASGSASGRAQRRLAAGVPLHGHRHEQDRSPRHAGSRTPAPRHRRADRPAPARAVRGRRSCRVLDELLARPGRAARSSSAEPGPTCARSSTCGISRARRRRVATSSASSRERGRGGAPDAEAASIRRPRRVSRSATTRGRSTRLVAPCTPTTATAASGVGLRVDGRRRRPEAGRRSSGGWRRRSTDSSQIGLCSHEVRALDERYALAESSSSAVAPSAPNQVLHTHGYREFFEHARVAAEGRSATADEDGPVDRARRRLEHIVAYTRRQRSWFKKIRRTCGRPAVKTRREWIDEHGSEREPRRRHAPGELTIPAPTLAARAQALPRRRAETHREACVGPPDVPGPRQDLRDASASIQDDGVGHRATDDSRRPTSSDRDRAAVMRPYTSVPRAWCRLTLRARDAASSATFPTTEARNRLVDARYREIAHPKCPR